MSKDISFDIPIELFDGCEAYDKESGEFLGWVNAKKKRIQKIIVTEIIRKDVS